VRVDAATDFGNQMGLMAQRATQSGCAAVANIRYRTIDAWLEGDCFVRAPQH
jgi:hypothetical protein